MQRGYMPPNQLSSIVGSLGSKVVKLSLGMQECVGVKRENENERTHWNQSY